MAASDKRNILYTLLIISLSLTLYIINERLYEKGLKGEYFEYYHHSAEDLISAYSHQFYAMTVLEKEKRREIIYFKDLFPGHWDQACPKDGHILLSLEGHLRYTLSFRDSVIPKMLFHELNAMGKECFAPNDQLTEENHIDFLDFRPNPAGTSLQSPVE